MSANTDPNKSPSTLPNKLPVTSPVNVAFVPSDPEDNTVTPLVARISPFILPSRLPVAVIAPSNVPA